MMVLIAFQDVEDGEIAQSMTDAIPRVGDNINIWDSLEDYRDQMNIDPYTYEVQAVFWEYIKGIKPERKPIPDVVIMLEKTFR